jgi:hypothetical protein
VVANVPPEQQHGPENEGGGGPRTRTIEIATSSATMQGVSFVDFSSLNKLVGDT